MACVGLLVIGAPMPVRAQASTPGYVDVHTHLWGRPAEALLMPPPRSDSILDPEEYSGLHEVARRHPDRFGVAAGGDVLNPLIHRYAPGQVTAETKERFRSEAERLAKDGVRAFGEMT